MASHESSKKRIRQTIKRTIRNRAARSSVRTFVKKVRDAIASGDKAAATQALLSATSGIDSAVTKGIFHRKTASRYVSRLSTAVNAL